MLLRRVSLVFALTVSSLGGPGLVAPAQAQAPQAAANAAVALPAGVQKVRSVEGINEYRLSNGLTVLLYPDPSKPTVTVNTTYLVGSRHENYGETGMAHLLEHLIFKGSKHYPNPDKEFSRRGFRNNGSTSFDRTNYFSTFQASDDNLRWAIGWSADSMVNSFIAKKDLDAEMTVVRNEYEMGETQPMQVLFKRLFALMFDWHNYGNLPIGNRSDIENVRIENLQAFYRRYYQPDNAVLTIAGQFDEAKTLRLIVQAFAPIARPKRTLPPLWTVEPTHDGERSVLVRRAGDIQIVLLGYRIPSALSQDADALSAAAEVLANTPNGRLHKEIVEKGLAAQVFAQPMPMVDPGVMFFGAIVKKGEPIEPARDRLIELVETSLAKQAPTEDEMTRYRRDAETSFERALADPQEFGVALSESIALGDWRLMFLERDRAAKVSAAQVATSANRYFKRDNRVIGVFVPEDQPQRADIPAPLTAAELLKDFKPQAAVAAGEVFDASQANIDERTRRLKFGDLQLALLPKKTRGETVNVSATFRYGDVASLQGKSLVQMMTAAMLSRGTQSLTRQQIADERTRLKMQGSLLEFQAARSTLPDALKLTAQLLREPSFPEAELEQLKREMLTSLQAQLSDPGARAQDLLLTHFNTYPIGDPRRYIPLAERIDAIAKITRQQLVDFHHQFYGTARGEIAVVGDFDDQALPPLLRELFAGWSSKAPYERITSEPRKVDAARLTAALADKENAYLRGRISLDLRDDDPEVPALLLANYVLGGGGLSNRLMDRLRQRDGVSYGVGSSLALSGRDRASAFTIGAIAAPQNIVKAEAAIREELQRFVRDGVSAEELEDAKRGLLQQRLMSRTDDAIVAAAWVNNLDLGRSFKFSQQVEERMRTVTSADVLAAVRKHLDPARLSVSIAGDAAKGAK